MLPLKNILMNDLLKLINDYTIMLCFSETSSNKNLIKFNNKEIFCRSVSLMSLVKKFECLCLSCWVLEWGIKSYLEIIIVIWNSDNIVGYILINVVLSLCYHLTRLWVRQDEGDLWLPCQEAGEILHDEQLTLLTKVFEVIPTYTRRGSRSHLAYTCLLQHIGHDSSNYIWHESLGSCHGWGCGVKNQRSPAYQWWRGFT